jgi:hypothetical protein
MDAPTGTAQTHSLNRDRGRDRRGVGRRGASASNCRNHSQLLSFNLAV